LANASAAILISKIQGNIVDIRMPPLRPAEPMFGAGRERRHAPRSASHPGCSSTSWSRAAIG
jgi:hypothetical protein